MGGMVIGITVLPNSGKQAARAGVKNMRRLQLVISENPGKIPLYRLDVNDPAATRKSEAEKQSALLGPPIILTRGEPVEIEVKNQSSNPTAIHWHGYRSGGVGSESPERLTRNREKCCPHTLRHHISSCQPTTHTKERDLDRIEHSLYTCHTCFTGSKNQAKPLKRRGRLAWFFMGFRGPKGPKGQVGNAGFAV